MIMWKPYQEIDFVKSIIYAKKMHTNLLKHYIITVDGTDFSA